MVQKKITFYQILYTFLNDPKAWIPDEEAMKIMDNTVMHLDFFSNTCIYGSVEEHYPRSDIFSLNDYANPRAWTLDPGAVNFTTFEASLLVITMC